METREASAHEVRVYLAMKANADWITSSDVAIAAHVSPRCARSHATKFVALGVAEVARVFPGHRYRLAAASKRNKTYVQMLERSAEVLGEVKS